MLEILLGVFALWLCFKIFGFSLKILYVLFLGIPLAILCWGIGLVLCCTILLIPVGKMFFSLGGKLAFPF